MSNVDFLSAGFSAILGTKVLPQKRSQKNGEKLSIHDLFSETYVMRPVVQTVDPAESFDVQINQLVGKTQTIRVKGEHTIAQVKTEVERVIGPSADLLRLMYDGKQLEDYLTVNDYGIQPDEAIYLVLRLRGGGVVPRGFNTDELNPDYDYDFTDVKDDRKRYMRRGFEYKRPYGWKRIAIKVVGKYADDKWLGPNGIRTDQARGEWPVSFHGTNMSGATDDFKTGVQTWAKSVVWLRHLHQPRSIYAPDQP